MAAAAISASALAGNDVRIVPFNVGADSYANGMSRNGRWATFQKQADAGADFDIRVMDLASGEFVTYTPQHMILYTGKESEFPVGSYSMTTGISDDGKTIIGTVNGYPAYFTVDDLTWHCVSMGDRMINRNYAGEIYDMSADGSVMTGWFCMVGAMTDFRGGVWKNGELQELTGLPSYEDMYNADIIGDEVFTEYREQKPNYAFRQLSADGNTLLYSINHNQPGWGCCYAIYDLANHTSQFITAPGDTPNFTESAVMSPDGNWVLATVYFTGGELVDDRGVLLLNVKTGESQLLNDVPDRDILATAVTNNGEIIGATPVNNPMRNAVVRHQNLWVDLSKLLAQKYGVDFTLQTGFDTTGYPVAVSADGRTVLFQAEFRGGVFALTLPESFSEAASGVSLLDEWAFSPLPGREFAELEEILIRFPYQCVPAEGAEISLLDSKGQTVAKASSIESFSIQNVLYTLRFPKTQLAKGETYTVLIPEGTFVIPGSTVCNPEIRAQYIGRDNAPVVVESMNPEAGSTVNELSFNNPLTIFFDTYLSLSNAVSAQLFEEGKENAVATLSAQVNGKTLQLYPAAARKLLKDKKYTVKVPEGLVADLGQCGPNAAFEIEFEGTYVPTPTVKPGYLFYDDMNDPAQSLNNFLLYEGDHLAPSGEMAGVGFDTDNTPWNFSVRDLGSADYCAMAHSMFETLGQADDWMFIPRLTISDADYYLTFRAQSYKQGCNDLLTLFVWESDEVLSSLDKATMDRIKAEGKTFREIQLTPSETEGLLEGGWQNFDFSLADFAGKNVYIGFANLNSNQSAVFVDEVAVVYRGAYALYSTTVENYTNAEEAPVSGRIAVNAEGPLNNLVASLDDGQGNILSTLRLDNLGLRQGDTYDFTFPQSLQLTKGVANPFAIKVTLDGIHQSFSGSIADHVFDAERRVLVEEGTGMWCGNCPAGEVAIEHMEKTMPESVAIISVHNQDGLVHNDYDQFLALGAYPKGRVNRSETVYSPLYNDPDLGDYAHTSPNGNNTFLDIVLRELEIPVEAEIKITDPVYYSADQVLQIPVTVRFSLSMPNKNYNVFTAIVEDGLLGRQTNYFAGQTTETLGWWSAQPGKVEWTYNNVAREVRGGFYGESGRVPKDIEAGVDYYTDALMPMPASVSNPENMKFVVALIDASNGHVVNSDVCSIFEVNDNPGAAPNGVDAITEADRARMTVENGRILVNGSPLVEVYTFDGRAVRNEALAQGLYIVRARLGDGSTFTARTIVR